MMLAADLHRLGEERSIAMHRAIAARLSSEPTIVFAARARVQRWLQTGAVHHTYAEAWDALLAGPVEQLAEAIVDPGERMRDLRQVSPFAGALDPRTRWRIHRQVARAAG